MAQGAKLPSCAAVDIILISSRGCDPSPWSRQLATRTADELATAGHRVRWLCALGPGEDPPEVRGEVELHSVPATSAAFRKVSGSIEGREMELLLATELRRRPSDVVHAVGFGEGVPAALLWIAERMGASPMVTLCARELLCHRQSLVDEQGRECRAWQDLQRCAECCLTATDGGLTPFSARLGRWLEPLGAWSPFPTRGAFLNRLETLLGGVASAVMVLVGSEEDAQLLALAGISVPVRVLDLERDHGVGLLDLYRRSAAAS